MTEKLRIIITALAVAVLLGSVPCLHRASAEEFKLPTPAELESFGREAMPFYIAGVAALDRADYGSAYSYLAKAAQLEPDAVRLNRIVAALALKHGRSRSAAEARGFYETAIASYQNVLRNPLIDDNLRRKTANWIKVATDERDNLEQRDARREAIGTYFVQELNREYTKKEREAKRAAEAAERAAREEVAAQVPAVTPAATPGIPGGAQPGPGGYPGVPPQAPAPGGMPGLPPVPGSPGAPGAPGGDPGSEVPI